MIFCNWSSSTNHRCHVSHRRKKKEKKKGNRKRKKKEGKRKKEKGKGKKEKEKEKEKRKRKKEGKKKRKKEKEQEKRKKKKKEGKDRRFPSQSPPPASRCTATPQLSQASKIVRPNFMPKYTQHTHVSHPSSCKAFVPPLIARLMAAKERA